MGRRPLPHHKTLDQIQLNAIPIVHELPLVLSLIKWVQNTLKGRQHHHPMAWMLLSSEVMSYSQQLEKIISLNKSVNQQKKTIRDLFINVGSFAKKHRKIEKAIFSLNTTVRELPIIEPEIHLLKMKSSLFDEPDLVDSLSIYTEKTQEMLKKVSELRQTVIDEVLASLSSGKQRIA